MATNIKREEAANAPKARAAALQTDLNKLENIKVRPAPASPLFIAAVLSLWRPKHLLHQRKVGSANNANPTCVSYNN